MKQKHPLRIWAAEAIAARRRARLGDQILIFNVLNPAPAPEPVSIPGPRPLTAAEYAEVQLNTIRETRRR